MALTADNDVYLGHPREIRDVAGTINSIVNANDGWNVAGWYRKGETVDASANINIGGGEITSDNHPIHISYLYPAQPSCLDGVKKYPRGHGAAPPAQN
jgi:hypothetical protein